MKWVYGAGGSRCLALTPSSADLLEDVLTSTHDALTHGYVTMNASELVDFNELCDQLHMSLTPLTPAVLPALRRVG
jgi:hypothetical protein